MNKEDMRSDGERTEEKGCTRCGGRLCFLGTKTFNEPKSFTVSNYFGDFLTKRPLSVFFCTSCGHLDLFVEP